MKTLLTSTVIRLAVLACLGNLAQPLPVHAQQKKPEPQVAPTFLGTIGEVKRKGMQTTVTVLPSLGGDAFEVPITPLMPLALEAKGDHGFLKEKLFVSAAGQLNNGYFLVDKWTVHVGPAAKKMSPSTRPLPDPIGEGEKKPAGAKLIEVTAPIISITDDEKDPGREIIVLRFGMPKGSPCSADKKAPVTVRSSDPTLLKEGCEVEYAIAGGTPKKPKLAWLKVTLPDAMKSEEFFATEEETKSSKK